MEQDIENNEKAMSSRFGQLVQAAEQGDSEAQLMLGSLLCKKAEGEERTGYAEQLKGYIEAAQWFRRAAEQGNADACFELGFSYNYGEGVDQDYEEAVKWYKKAIDISGHGSALYHLGECYHYGHGVPKNEEEAKSLFRLVESKDGLLGLYYVYDGRGVRSWEKKRLEDAMNGNAEDQYYVGRWYEDHYDLKGSNEKAVEWYQKAAVQGLAEAQNSLGKCYEWGKDVAQDDKKAAELYRNAAEQGLADAQNNLARCYSSGKGVKQDKKKAIEWYRRAAEQGLAEAAYALGECYDNGVGVEQDYKKAVEWYNEAVNAKLPEFFTTIYAAKRLSECYRLGLGVEKDLQEAEKWQRISEGEDDDDF